MSKMKRIIKAGVSTVLVILQLTVLKPATTVQADTAWNSSERYDTWTDDDYTLRNNIWGSNAGVQSIWANSYSNWGVWAEHPNTNGIKSYPHAEKVINAKLSDINTLVSNFDVTVPTSGTSMETCYDIWLDNYSYEIMLWMNEYGKVGPISDKYDALGNAIPCYTLVSIGGDTWNIYKGNNGANMVYTFVRANGNINSGSADIKAIANWIKDVPKWYGDVVLGQVQFGYEITSSSNNGYGYNFITNSFSVNFN